MSQKALHAVLAILQDGSATCQQLQAETGYAGGTIGFVLWQLRRRNRIVANGKIYGKNGYKSGAPQVIYVLREP
jgi:hypothetical protein